MSEFGKFKTIICTIGVLHDDIVKPEKRLIDIDLEKLSHYFYVNTILSMMVIKHFSPLLNSEIESRFVCLSAMVGSTSDNQLGGWYGYRASKAALNSLIKTTSIELNRTNKNSCLVAIHSGMTIGELSAPYATRINPKKILYTRTNC